MSEIQGGTVKFLKRLNKGNYEHEEVQFEIGFGGDNPEAVLRNLDFAASLAKTKALVLLGVVKESAPITNTIIDAGTYKPAVDTTPSAEAAQTAKRSAGRPPGSPNKTRMDTLAAAAPPVEDDVINLQPEQIVKSEPQGNGIEITDEEDVFAASAPEITDKDLQHAIVEHNKLIKDAAAIKLLIGEFVAPPGRSSDIPAARRHEFIERLKQIQPK